MGLGFWYLESQLPKLPEGLTLKTSVHSLFGNADKILVADVGSGILPQIQDNFLTAKVKFWQGDCKSRGVPYARIDARNGHYSCTLLVPRLDMAPTGPHTPASRVLLASNGADFIQRVFATYDSIPSLKEQYLDKGFGLWCPSKFLVQGQLWE